MSESLLQVVLELTNAELDERIRAKELERRFQHIARRRTAALATA